MTYHGIIKLLFHVLDEEHFDFANKPKIVPLFMPIKHWLPRGAVMIVVIMHTTNNKSTLHFTVSQAHLEQFQEIVSKVETIELN
jgi:hypothetical protein